MIKYLTLLLLISLASCNTQKSIIEEHVTLDIYTYESENVLKAGAMPVLKPESELNKYQFRFDYLLMNVSEVHQINKTEERNAIFGLYPDTVKLQKVYMKKFIQDKKLVACFEESYAPIKDPDMKRTKTYTTDELMDVASKFFYCDLVLPDTNVQSHVCVGLNGIKEASWEKDYTLLAAFCFEAIFADFHKDQSPVDESYSAEKSKAVQKYRANISNLDQYLEDVKLELFERMKNDEVLKKALLEYYEENKSNLAFRII